MGWLNALTGEISEAQYFAPNRGLNSLLGQFNAYVLKVVDEGGNPIVGAIVTCTNDENSDTHSFITDANGEALFEPFVEWVKVGVNGVDISRWLNTNVTIVATGFNSFEFSYQTSGQGDYRVIVLRDKSGMKTAFTGIILVDDIPREESNDTCYCLKDCEYRERVFTDGIGTDHWKNDKSSFLQRKIAPTDTVVFELWKAGQKIADINSDLYGVFYPTFAAQPNYTGVIIDWFKVQQNHGFGVYQIYVNRTILGNTELLPSRIFKLEPYSDRDAENTVVIESYQDGNVISSQFDYTGLVPGGWLQQWRVKGNFGDKTPSIETDRLEDSNRNTIQVQDKISNEYTLDIHTVTGEIFNAITQDAILGNELLITDFRIMAPEIFRRVSVAPTSFESTTDKQNRRIRTVIKMTDSRNDRVKRNF